jgi:Cytochrome P450
MYPEPDVFKPERFINPNGTLREDPVLGSPFGFGKRVCPGRHLADATLFIAIASLLSVFNIKKSSGGTDNGPDMYPTTGKGFWCDHRVLLVVLETWRADWHFLVSTPCPFTCSITPRDRRAEELITANASEQ